MRRRRNAAAETRPECLTRAQDLGQSGRLAGDLHEGLRPEDSGHQGGLRGAGSANRVFWWAGIRRRANWSSA